MAISEQDNITHDITRITKKALKEFSELKEKLAEKKKTSPFFDSTLYARHFEQVCLDMIEIYKKEHKG